MVMPELALFSLSGHLQTTGGVSPVPPSISVDCDDQSFQVLVRYGNQGQTFQTLVGGQTLTAELARQYGLRQNATHFSLTVLYSSPNVVFEVPSAGSRCCQRRRTCRLVAASNERSDSSGGSGVNPQDKTEGGTDRFGVQKTNSRDFNDLRPLCHTDRFGNERPTVLARI